MPDAVVTERMVTDTVNHVDDEDRREFLRALGVTGVAAAGSVTLSEVQSAVSDETSTELAPVGRAVRDDLAGSIDAAALASQRSAFAVTTSELRRVTERGLPEDGPREEFRTVAEAGRPLYDHLVSVGFFESTTTHLPSFDAGYIEDSVRTAIDTDAFVAPLADLGLTDAELVDLVATVVAHRERIGDQHWVQTDELPRERMEIGDFIAPMTRNAAGGVLLWLADLDRHLWGHRPILTDEILADAVWEARAMAAGFHLVTEGARIIGEEDGTVSESELGALLSSGFALQAVAQSLLPEDVYWVTEEMRAPARTDLEPAETTY